MSRFKAIVSTGVSNLGQCSFTTLTYQSDGFREKGAGCVKKDWTALRRRLKQNAPWVSEMKWLRVMELTKKGTPHHHLVMGPMPTKATIRCWRRDQKIVAEWYLGRLDTCPCLSHTMSREWYAVTKDSWMVHTVPVTSSKGAGGYLAKYMRKEFDGERAELLGMSRRWSTSKGWPSERRQRLQTSVSLEGWRRRDWKSYHVDALLVESGPADLHNRTGTAAVKAAAGKRQSKRLIKSIQEKTNA